MDIHKSRVLILGGSGLVGGAIAREMLRERPSRLMITALSQREAERGRAELQEARSEGTNVACQWGDLFLAEELKDERRTSILESPEKRRRLLDDLYGPLDDAMLRRSFLYRLIKDERPDIVVDCVSTATAIAYQDVFTSVERLRAGLERGEQVSELLDRHLAIIYLPQLIRHVQVLLEALRAGGVAFYMKVGTSGTGGMGLNIPFTHSEQRPSHVLLAKAGVAGAHSLLLFLTARTPGAPAVKEIKPTAAIAWKRIGVGPIERGGTAIELYDAVEPLPLDEAFGGDAGGWRPLDRRLESVYLDAGENGQFSRDEFEAISSLGMMEIVTPEEIANAVIREIRGHPTGLDVVAALDSASMGPTYRGGVLRELALRRLEELEDQSGHRSVAFEILGPPRLSKLLFEAHILEKLFGTLSAATELRAEWTAAHAEALLRDYEELRVTMLSVGIPALLPDGRRVLRGPEVKVEPGDAGIDDRLIARGWVDLRPGNWTLWRDRVRRFLSEVGGAPRPDDGSIADIDLAGRTDRIRPGVLGAWIFKREDRGERLKHY